MTQTEISEWHLRISAYLCSSSSILIIHKFIFWTSHTEWIFFHIQIEYLVHPHHHHPPRLNAQQAWNVEIPHECQTRQNGPNERLLLAHLSDFSLLVSVLLPSQILNFFVCVLGIGGTEVLLSSHLERSVRKTQDKAILYICLHGKAVCIWVRECLRGWDHITPTGTYPEHLRIGGRVWNFSWFGRLARKLLDPQ